MARSRKGHPVPVRLRRVIAADLLVAELIALALVVVSIPLSLGRFQHVSAVEAAILCVLALTIFYLLGKLVLSVRSRFSRWESWLRETYELAKLRRCFWISMKNLTFLERSLSLLLAIPACAGLLLLLRIPLFSFFVAFHGAGDLLVQTVGFSLVILVVIPLVVVAFRMSVFVAVHAAGKLNSAN